MSEKMTEMEFLNTIKEYCDDMKIKVGHSILDDFNRIIKTRIKRLTITQGDTKDE